MKNYWFALLALLLVLAGCEKNSTVDNRDAFVGTYEYVTEGEMTLSGPMPELNPKLPLNTEGTFTISKVSDKDSVLISGAINGKLTPFKAIVKGSQLEFVGDEFSAKGENFEVMLSISNHNAPVVNDTLTWVDNNVSCLGTLYGFDLAGEGNVKLKACKKSVK